MMELDAAPAGARVHSSRSRATPGAPPGGTMTPCEELADGGPRGLPEARKAQPPKRGRRLRAGGRAKRNVRKRGPAPYGRRDGAPNGAHPQPEGARAARRGLKRMRHRKSGLPDLRSKHARSRVNPRSSALRPLAFCGEQEEGPARAGMGYGVPGAAQITRARRRALLEYGRRSLRMTHL